MRQAIFKKGEITMTDEKLKEMLINQMDEMDEEDVLYIWNDYAYDCRPDDVIYENDEDVLNELFSRPSDAIRAIYYGDYTFNDPYFYFNGYANIQSVYSLISDTNSIVSLSELADWLIEDERYENYDFEIDDDDDDDE
jgi:hypothetical protein